MYLPFSARSTTRQRASLRTYGVGVVWGVARSVFTSRVGGPRARHRTPQMEGRDGVFVSIADLGVLRCRYGAVHAWNGSNLGNRPGCHGCQHRPRAEMRTRSSGDVVRGDEWVWQLSENAALVILSTILGPEANSYTGPMPTESDAKRALQASEVVPIEQITRDRVPCGSSVVRLNVGVGRAILEDTAAEQSSPARPLSGEGQVRAVLWRSRCLIIRVPGIPSLHYDLARPCARIAVVDRVSGRPICYFSDNYHEVRAPRARWSK